MLTDKDIEQRIIERLEKNSCGILGCGLLLGLDTARLIVHEAFAESKTIPVEPKWTPSVRDIVAFSHYPTDRQIVGVITTVGDVSVTVNDVRGDHYSAPITALTPATPEEIAEFYTLEFEGMPYRLYHDENGNIRIVCSDGSMTWLFCDDNKIGYSLIANATLAGLGLTRDSHLIKLWKEGCTFDPPKET